jgi:hypothetical protein
MPRNTFAKGLKRYRFETMEEEFQEAWSSPYRCWWSFLSCSKDYWWVCQKNGETEDSELKRTYESFGDVHLNGFAAWWTEAARDNFLEQIDPPNVELINPHLPLDVNQPDEYPWMIVRVPLNLGREKLIQDFSSILEKHPDRVHHRDQTSKYPLLKHKNLHEDVLLRTCDLWHAVNRLGGISAGPKQKGDSDSYYEIGERFGANPKQVINPSDRQAVADRKRSAMKTSVSRMLSQAKNLIANVEIGRFPSNKPVVKRARWNPDQQRELDQAVLRGEWQPRQMNQNDWAIEFREVHDHYRNMRLHP